MNINQIIFRGMLPDGEPQVKIKIKTIPTVWDKNDARFGDRLGNFRNDRCSQQGIFNILTGQIPAQLNNQEFRAAIDEKSWIDNQDPH